MKILLHDLGEEWNERLSARADKVICADGKYAPCRGCFRCWTRHPASCAMKDSLQQICRILGQADELVVITGNCYGGYSPQIKTMLDRSIGMSTPFAVMRGGQMHHTLRYGVRGKLKVVSFGEISPKEKKTMELLAERNAVNFGYTQHEVLFLEDPEQIWEAEI